jgi:hypothetical protein
MAEDLAPDRDVLARLARRPRDHVDRVDFDKDSRLRLTFPTLGNCGS